MNSLVMKNVTTNENIRKKWNAKGNAKSIQVSTKEKFKYFYWDKLEESRIEKYFKLRDQAVEMAKEHTRQASASMASQGSMGHSVGGGSVNDGGFDVESQNLEANVYKNLKVIQKKYLKEIDNKAVLLSYGIDIPTDRPKTKSNNLEIQDPNERSLNRSQNSNISIPHWPSHPESNRV